MSTLKKLKDTPFYLAFSVAIAVGGAMYPIITYFHEKEIAGLKSKYERGEASIKRNVHGIKEFEIANLILTPSSSGNISDKHQYFESDNFYANNSDKYWNYSHITELEYTMQSVELEEGSLESKMLESILKMGGNNKLHFWRHGEAFHIKDNSTTYNIYQHIVIQRVDFDIFKKLKKTNSDDNTTGTIDAILSNSTSEFTKNIENVLYNDAAGAFFMFQCINLLNATLFDNNKQFSILEMQKVGNVLYCKLRTTMNNVIINNKSCNCYIHQEMIVFSSRDHFYLIKITIPSLEPTPRDSSYLAVNRFIDSVKFVVK